MTTTVKQPSTRAKTRGDDDRKQVLTPKELADRWSVSSNTIYRLIELGNVPQFFKIGGQFRFPMAQVLSFENGNH